MSDVARVEEIVENQCKFTVLSKVCSLCEAARFGYFYMKHLLTCFALFAGQSQKVEKKGVLSVDIWEDLLTKVS